MTDHDAWIEADILLTKILAGQPNLIQLTGTKDGDTGKLTAAYITSLHAGLMEYAKKKP